MLSCMIQMVMLSGVLESIVTVFVPIMYRKVSEVSNNRLAHVGSLQPIHSITIE